MDEAMTAIAGELEAPAIETQQQETAQPETEAPDTEEVEASEIEGEEGEQGEGEGDEPKAPEVELIEVERNGKKYSIPKELEPELLMQADYTRKTQEVAAERKAVEAQKEQATALYQASQEYIEAKAAVKMIEGQLQQYQNVNWAQLEQEDPMGAMSHWRQFQTLKEQYQQGTQYLQNAENERTEKAQQDIAKRLQETRQFAQEKIPGWTPEVDAKVVSFATSELGFDIEQIKAAINPGIYKTLHLAWLGSQTLQKQNAAPPRQQTPPKPLSTVTPKASPSARKNPGEMSVDEMAAFLNKR
jgi:hypothetical protein